MERDKFVRFLSGEKDFFEIARKFGNPFQSEVGDLLEIAQSVSRDGWEPHLILAVEIDPPHRWCLIERQAHNAIEHVKRTKKQKEDIRQIYLMKNRRNGFVKIGLSKDPAYREGTLQAEEPEVELLFSSPGNQEIEEGLHSMFSNKRLRGEWFALSGADILEIKEAVSIWGSKL